MIRMRCLVLRLVGTLLALLAAGGALAAATAAAPAPSTPAPARHPAAVAAEEAFFAAFVGGGPREAPLVPLLGAWAAAPDDARTNLLLGLDHLWIAAEGEDRDPRLIEHLLLAELFLTRARELDPADERIASWLMPARLALADLRRDPAAAAAAREELLAAYRRDPAFHGFTVAMLGFGHRAGTPAFARGLAALDEVAASGCAEGDPTCENRRRWPHNVEAYLTFSSDYRLKAGDREGAAALLAEAGALPSYAEWPFRGEAEARLAALDERAALYANADPADDPPSLFASHGCRSCHLAAAAAR